MAEVVSPRAFTYSATSHQWLTYGLSASRTLPTICVHICKVSQVAFHSVSGSAGHASSFVNVRPVVIVPPQKLASHSLSHQQPRLQRGARNFQDPRSSNRTYLQYSSRRG